MMTLPTCSKERSLTLLSQAPAPEKHRQNTRRHRPAAARTVMAFVVVSLVTSGCIRGEDKGWGRDMQNQWYAYCLSGWFSSRDSLDFFAVSRRRFAKIDWSIGEDGPRTVAVEGVTYKFWPSRKGNLYLVREDGTVYSSAYWMTVDEFHELEGHMDAIDHSDVIESLRKTLDEGRLDEETRKFLGME